MSSFYLRSSTSICRRFNLSAPCSNKYKMSLPYSAPCTTQQNIKIGPCVKLIQMPSDKQQLHVSAGQNVESSFHLSSLIKFKKSFHYSLQRYILTAMHCVFYNRDSPQSFFVLAGIHDICPSNTEPFQKRFVKVRVYF